jgi:hypothetical protein
MCLAGFCLINFLPQSKGTRLIIIGEICDALNVLGTVVDADAPAQRKKELTANAPKAGKVPLKPLMLITRSLLLKPATPSSTIK